MFPRVVEEADINDLGVLLSSENDSKELSIIFIAHCAPLYVKPAPSRSRFLSFYCLLLGL